VNISVMSHAMSAGAHRRARAIIVEFAVMMAVFMLYRSGRMFTRDATDQAMGNAGRVIDFERALGIFNERAVQGWALGSDVVVDFLNRYYVAVHFPLTIAFLVWAYIRHQNAYRFIRTWFVGVTLAALVIHVGFPLAPPRMTSGFVDTLHEFGPRIYNKDPRRSVTNQFAAMPSLHFGWAFMMAIGFVAIKRSRNSVLMMLHPAITLLAIVATGNHYWLDAIVAGLLAAIVAVMLGAWRLHRSGRPDGQQVMVADADSSGASAGGALVPAYASAGDEHGCPLATHSRDRCRQHVHERHERIELEPAGSGGAPVVIGSARADQPPDER
jgi:hypothetical protein